MYIIVHLQLMSMMIYFLSQNIAQGLKVIMLQNGVNNYPLPDCLSSSSPNCYPVLVSNRQDHFPHIPYRCKIFGVGTLCQELHSKDSMN